MTRSMRVFKAGQDRDTLVPFVTGDDRTLAGNLLARDPMHPHLLIEFDDMLGSPCWIPDELVNVVFDEPDRFTHYIPVQTPGREVVDPSTGEIIEIPGPVFETNALRFGRASFTMPAWIATNLDRLTARLLRDARAQRAADKEAEKRRNAARSLRLQSDVELQARVKAKRKKREPDQGELL